MLKRTPFYPRHVSAGGRLVPFAGHELPLQFSGIISEHRRVRTTVGVFDVSHMGRIEVTGHDALTFLNRVTTNDVGRLSVGQAQYSVLCYPDGGIVDDLVVYRLEDRWLLVVNGANNEKDTRWLEQHLAGDVRLNNVTAETAQLAVQGPQSESVMQKVCSDSLANIGPYWSVRTEVGGVQSLVSRTGYTGEDGFEVYVAAEQALAAWDAVFAAGRDYNIEPIGLGARDTLRLEMKMCLYGNDIDETTNPVEAGLSWVVKLEKPGGFIGSDVLTQIVQAKPTRRLVCIEMKDRGIPRPKCPILADGEQVGFVTSGTMSPSLNKGIALGYVRRDCARLGTQLAIDIRGNPVAAEVVKPPFYKKGSRKQGG
ncbi:MAG: glycine cleavage system aminomethyltransferase GcvT [candidate division WOR-3 bacterium]